MSVDEGVYVEDLGRLHGVPPAMEDLATQMSQVVDYATTYVCRREPFEPSPLCVLRPLAGAMTRLAGAFEDLGALWAHEWAELEQSTCRATSLIEDADSSAVGAAERLMSDLVAATFGVPDALLDAAGALR
ncbi:hypothetical protein [Nocardioides acrostichi]|uniref:Uncharacterized protein n=1 Tax=Nocardioides acrostichi TaxID=2784339 RepID=A0A930UWR3_9ACTN|nr:hypothetical protein [Nocardioides acrostichi]MBF4161561.1 hypothetical protein [Nocardioides acrostichi]